jgi:hypothetical protein
MSPRKTWFWVTVAVAMFGFIFVRERFFRTPAVGPARILPNFRALEVSSVKVQLPGQLAIRADRTNDTWQLSTPIEYPAQAPRIDTLLRELEQLSPAGFIDGRELSDRPHPEEDFGLSPEQASIILQQPGHQTRLLVGYPTAPGDQVFLQTEPGGVFIADAAILKLIPHNVDDWRDTALVRFDPRKLDALAVTNASIAFELIRDPSNGLWRIAPPFQLRADNSRIDKLLDGLQKLAVSQFYSDQTNADLEPLGLQQPQLQIALRQGTNLTALLQFGKSPTNDTRKVFARRSDHIGIVTVPVEALEPWKASVNDFRDPHLVVLTEPVNAIEVRAGESSFSLRHGTNDAWRVQPQDIPADSGLVQDLLSGLAAMQVAGMAGFVKDVVAEPDLAGFGFTPPARSYILKSSSTSSNSVLAELDFGKVVEDRIYARRAEESSVYAVRLADYSSLPSAPWQFRDRQVWNKDENDVTHVTIRQQGKVREIIRHGVAVWSLAPGSQGVIEPAAIEDTVQGLCHLTAQKWIAQGEQQRPAYGLTNGCHSVSLEFKNGEKTFIEFGAISSDQVRYAATTLDGQLPIFEMAPQLDGAVRLYLIAP